MRLLFVRYVIVIVALSVMLMCGAPLAGAQDNSFTYLLLMADNSELTGVSYGEVAFVDLARDNDLDVLAMGNSFNAANPKAYTADGYVDEYVEGRNPYWRRVFRSVKGFQGMWKGGFALGDLDRDGVAEIIANGATRTDAPLLPHLSVLSIGGARLVKTDGAYNGSAALGDFDNDGDEDLLVAGIAAGRHVTQLIRWEAGAWVQTETNLPDVAYSTAAWGDVDGDSDLDLFLSGVMQDGRRTADIYENQEGVLVARQAQLPSLLYGSAAWGDYDSDGDLDLVLSGGKIDPLLVYRGVTHILRNDGGTFMLLDVDLPGILLGEADWGDADNDGDLDLLLAGNTTAAGQAVTKLMRNTSGGFTLSDRFAALGYRAPSSDWGDYNGDGDIDLLISGTVTGNLGPETVIGIFRNDISVDNAAPVAPTGLHATTTPGVVTFTWDAPDDDHTPSQSLTYNLRVGTTPGGIEIISPLAHAETGQRWVSGFGNTGLGTSHFLRNLPSGAYYWSIQAIDTSFKGSPFAEEGTFVIP